MDGGVAALANAKDRVTRTCRTVTEDRRTGPKLTERTRVACAIERRRGLCRGGRQLVVKRVVGRLCPDTPGDGRCPILRMSQGSPGMGRLLKLVEESGCRTRGALWSWSRRVAAEQEAP